jgi:hypothetical protein
MAASSVNKGMRELASGSPGLGGVPPTKVDPSLSSGRVVVVMPESLRAGAVVPVVLVVLGLVVPVGFVVLVLVGVVLVGVVLVGVVLVGVVLVVVVTERTSRVSALG